MHVQDTILSSSPQQLEVGCMNRKLQKIIKKRTINIQNIDKSVIQSLKHSSFNIEIEIKRFQIDDLMLTHKNRFNLPKVDIFVKKQSSKIN